MSAVTPAQEKAPSPRRSKFYKCGQKCCPGLGIKADAECCMRGVLLHSFCISEAVVEVS
jgi:hypothetical protein